MKKFIVAAITVLILNTILLSENCQSQWASYTLPYEGYANTLGFYDLNHGVSFGHYVSYSFHEKIFYTTNSGVNWIQANYPPELMSINDVQYINANTIYACGGENLSFSNNYNPVNDFRSFPKNVRERFLIKGYREFNNVYKGAFIKSTDGGLNWQRGSQFDTSTGYVVDINFFNANTGYALFDSYYYGNTKFYKTTNGGTNWQFVRRIDTASVWGMHFFDMNTGTAYGYSAGGRIYKTTNAGMNWSIITMPSQIDCMTFFNSTTGIAIGVRDNGGLNYVYKTTNAGINWNVNYTINGIKLFYNLMTLQNTGTAFAIGNNSDTVLQMLDKITTLKTTNFGLNWVSKDFNPKILALGLALVDSNNFFIGAGDYNAPAQILKSTNGGNVFVNQIGTVVPSVYSLGQNFPNPFNPSTVIRYQLPVISNVVIKIYDVMGREVETLVNERLQAGTYETSFDGSGLNSGVYFYRLTADGFSETRRMMLLK